jgi:DNA-binding NarL/FixJ family response regulator
MNAQGSGLSRAVESVPTRVLIVDSHTIVREGATVLLGFEDALAVIGHAATVGDCLRDADRLSPDLIITEIDVGGPGNVEELRRAFPSSLVLVLSLLDSEEAIRAALAAGAHGYVLKESGRKELLSAIRTVLSGTRFLCERASARIVTRFLDDGTASRAAATLSPITRSEREILAMVARGMSNKHIARLRERSVRTIEKQRAMLMRKLGLRNAADLTRFALEHGLIQRDQVDPSLQASGAA